MRSSLLFSLLILVARVPAISQPADTLLAINGTTIYVRSIGTGEPLVVVHGGPGLSHEYLFEPFSSLGDQYRVIFYDQRGCGRSAAFAPGDSATMQTLVDDLEALRRRLAIDRMNLVGQSWGALIAINYAIAHPEAVHRLLLLEPAPGSREYLAPVQQAIISRLTPSARERLAMLSRQPELRTDPVVFREFLTVRTDTYFADTLLARIPRFSYFDGEMVKKFFASSAMFGPYMMQYDLYDELGRVSAPTLIVHGDFDVIPTEAIERMGKAIPRSEVHIIQQCGHFVHLERPSLYFQLVRAFLEKSSSAR